jgi:MtaA/CmuA family methyltransferase
MMPASTDTMTPLERVVAARVPVALYFMSGIQHDIVDMDYTWEEVLNHPRKLYQAVERQFTVYGADNFFVPVDFRVEGEALGSKVEYRLKTGGGMRMAWVTDWALKDKKDLDKFSVPDPTKAGRMPVILEVIKRLKAKYPDVPIVGFVNGPPDTMTDFYLGHFRQLFVEIASDPKFVHECLELCTQSAIVFAKAMLAAGAVAIATVEGGMIDEAISPAQYGEFVVPYHKKIRDAIGAPYIFHQCENATPFMDMIVDEIQPACVAFHDSVDLAWAKERYGSRVAIAGNVGISKVGAPFYGTRDDVLQAAKKCLEIGMPGSGFLLSAGCEVHHGIPIENVSALREAADRWGRY